MFTTQFSRLKVCSAALILVGFAGLAQGQPPYSKGPQLPQSKFNADEYFSKQDEKLKAAMATQKKAEVLESGWNFSAILLSPVIWIAALLVVLSGLTWVYVRLSATTSTAALASSDPWIRARLAQGQPGEKPGTDEPGQ